MQAVPATNSDQLKEEPSVYVKEPNKPAAIHYPKDVKPKGSDKPNGDGTTSEELSKPQLLTDEGKAYVLAPMPKDGSVSEDTSPVIALQIQPLENVPVVQGVVDTTDGQLLRVEDPRSGEAMVAVPTSDQGTLQKQPCIFVDKLKKPAAVYYPDSADRSDLVPVQPSDTTSLESGKPTAPVDDTKEPVKQISTDKGPAYILKPVKEGDITRLVVVADKTPLANKPQELEILPSEKDGMEPEHRLEPFFVQDPNSGEILAAVPATNSEDIDNFPTAYGKDLDKLTQLYYPKPGQDISDVPESGMGQKVPSDLDAEDMDVDKPSHKQLLTDKGLAFTLKPLPKGADASSIPQILLQSKPLTELPKPLEVVDKPDAKPYRVHDPPTGKPVLAVPTQDTKGLEEGSLFVDDINKPAAVYYPQKELDEPDTDSATPTICAKPEHQQINTDKGLAYVLTPCSPEDLKENTPIVSTKKHPLKHLPKVTGLEVVPDEQPFKVKDPKSGKLMQAVPATNSDQLKEEPSVFVKEPNKHAAIHYPKVVKPKASDKPISDDTTSDESHKQQLLTDEGKAYVLTPLQKDGDVSEDTSPLVALQTQPLENAPAVQGVANVADAQPLRVQDPRSGKPMVAVPTSDENALQNQPCIFVDNLNKPAVVHYPDSADSGDLVGVQPSHTTSFESVKPTLPPGFTKEPVEQINTDKGPAYILKPTQEEDITGPVVLADKIPLMKKPQELENLSSGKDGMDPDHTHEPFFVQDPNSGEILEAVPATNSEDLDNFPTAYGKDLDKPIQLYYPMPEQDMSDVPDGGMGRKVPSDLDIEDMVIGEEPSDKQLIDDARTEDSGMVGSDVPDEEETYSHMPTRENSLQPDSNTEALDVSPKYGKVNDEPTSFDVMLAKSMDQYDVNLEKSPVDPDAVDIPSRSKEDTLQPAKPKHQQINTDKGLAYVLKPCSPEDLKQKAPIISTKKHPLKHLPKVTGLEVVPDEQPFKVKDPKSGKLMQAVPATNSDQLKEETSVYVKEPNKPAAIHYPEVVRPKESDKLKKDVATLKETNKPQFLTDEGKAYVLSPMPNDGSVSENTIPIISLQTQPLENVPVVQGVVDTTDVQALRVKDPRSGEPMVALPTSDEDAIQKQPCIFVDDINKPAVVHYPNSADSGDLVGIQPPDTTSLESVKPTTPLDDTKEPVEQINTDKGPAFILKPTQEEDVTGPVVHADKTPLAKKPQEVEKLPSDEDGMEPEHRHEPFFVQDPSSGEILEAVPATNSEDLDNFPTAYGKDLDKPMQVYYPKPGQDITAVPEDNIRHRVPRELDAEDIDVDEPSHKQLLTDKGLAFLLKPLPKEVDAGSIPQLSLQSRPLTELPKPLEVVEKPDAKPYRVHDPRTGKNMLAVPTQDTKGLEEGSVFVDDINKPAAVYYPQKELGKSDTDAATPTIPAKPEHQQINTDKGLVYVLKPCSPEDLKEKTPIVSTNKHPLKHVPKVTGLEVVPDEQPFKVKDPKSGKLMQAVPATNSDQLKEEPSVFVKDPNKPAAIHYPKVVKPKASDIPIKDGTTSVEPSKSQLLTDEGKAYVLTPMPKDGSVSEDAGPIIALKTQPLENVPVIQGVVDAADAKPLRVQDPRSGEPMVAVPTSNDDALQKQPCIFVDDINKPAVVHYPRTGDEEKEKPVVQQITTDKGPAYILKPVQDDDPVHDLVPTDIAPLADKPKVVGIEICPEKVPFCVKDPVSGNIMQAVPATNSEQLEKMPSAYAEEADKPIQIYHPQSEQSKTGISKETPFEPLPEDTDTTDGPSYDQLLTDKGLAYSLQPLPEGINKDLIPLLALQSQPLEEMPKPLQVVQKSYDNPYRVVDPRSGKLALVVPTIDKKALEEASVYVEDLDKPATVYYPQKADTSGSRDAAAAKVPTHQQINTDKGLAYTLNPLTPEDRMQRAPVVSTKKKPLKHLPKLIGVETVPDAPPFKVKDQRSGNFMHAIPVTNSEQLKEKPSVFVTKPKKPATIYYPDTSQAEMQQEPEGAKQSSKSAAENVPEDSMQVFPADETTPVDQGRSLTSIPQIVTDEGPAYVLKPSLETCDKSQGQTKPLIAETDALNDRPDIVGIQQAPSSKPFKVLDPNTGEVKDAVPAETVEQIEKEPCVFVKDPKQTPKIHYPSKADDSEEPSGMEGEDQPEESTPQQILTDKGWAFKLQPTAGGGSAGNGSQDGATMPTHIAAVETDPDSQPNVASLQHAPDMIPFHICDPATGDIMEGVPVTNAEELHTEPVAFVSGENKPITVYDPETGKTKVAYPAIDSVEKPPKDETDNQSSEGEKIPYVKEPEKKQLATDKGLAFILTPLSADDHTDAPFMTVDTDPLEEAPSVEGLVSNPDAKPFRVLDPLSGEQMIAVPATSPEDLENEPSAYLSDTNKPALVHHPSKTLKSDSKLPTELDSTVEEPGEEVHSGSIPAEEGIQQQILTNKGWAYTLKPTDETNKTDKGDDVSDSPEYILSSENVPNDVPSFVTLQDAPNTKPFKVEDPDSGDIMIAVPATAPEDLNTKPTVFVTDPDDPVTVYDPVAGETKVAYPSGQYPKEREAEQSVDQVPVKHDQEPPHKIVTGVMSPKRTRETEPDMVPLDLPGEEETDSLRPSSEGTLRPDSNTEALDVSPKYGKGDNEPTSYDVMLAKSMDQYDVYLEKAPVDPDAADIPPRLGENMLQPNLTTRDDQPHSETSEINKPQLITDQGPAYVLTPLDDDHTDSAIESNKGKPDYTVSDEEKPANIPVVIGARTAPVRPIVVSDPMTGQTMVANPAENLDDLDKYTTAYMDDDRSEPMKVHDPRTGQMKTAYPEKKTKTPDGRTADSEESSEEMESDTVDGHGPKKGSQGTPSDKPLDEFTGALATQPGGPDTETEDVLLPKSMSEYDVFLETPPTDPDQLPVPAEDGHLGDEDFKASATSSEDEESESTDGQHSDEDVDVKDDSEQPIETFLVTSPTESDSEFAGPDAKNSRLGEPSIDSGHPMSSTPIETSIQSKQANRPFVVVVSPVPEPTDDVTPSAKPSDKVPSMQLVTDQGPAYVLVPFDDPTKEVDDVRSGSEGDGSAPGYIISPGEVTDQKPVVTGARSCPDTKPIKIVDPETGKEAVAKPCGSLKDITDKPTAVIDDDRSKPATVYYPDSNKGVKAHPTSSDAAIDSKPDLSKLKTPKHKFDVDADEVGAPHEEQPMRPQVMTEKGPAYKLRPLSETDISSSGDDEDSNVTSPPEYTVIQQTPVEALPVIVGVQDVPASKPIVVQDPNTGQPMFAEPVENPEEFSEGPVAVIEETPDKPMKIYDNDEGEVKVAVPSEDLESLSSEDDTPTSLTPKQEHEQEPSKSLREPKLAVPATSKQRDSDKDVPDTQIVTEKGPAYVLTPVSDQELDSIIKDADDAGGMGPEYTILSETMPENVPPIASFEPVSDAKPFVVIDPATKQKMLAQPALQDSDLNDGVVGIIGDARGKPLKLYDNNTGNVSLAFPTTPEEGDDFSGPQERPESVSPIEQDLKPPISYGQIQPDDDSFGDYFDDEQSAKQQVMTEVGPAYTLRPISESELADVVAASGGLDGPYSVSEEVPSESIPSVLGLQEVPRSKPFVVQDPHTGQILLADVAESPVDLVDGLVGVIEESPDRPLKIHDTNTGKVYVAHPSDSPVDSDPKESKEPRTTESRDHPDKPLSQKLMTAESEDHPDTPDMVSEDVVASVLEPVEEPWKNKVEDLQSDEPSKSEDVPPDSLQKTPANAADGAEAIPIKPAQKPTVEKTKEASPDEDAVTQQIITKKGPAFVLKPISEWEKDDINKSWPQEEESSLEPEFTVLCNLPTEKVPPVTGINQILKSKPIIVQDPSTGQLLAAEPAKNVGDLGKEIVGILEDSTPDNKEMKIHDTTTGQVSVAVPSETLREPESESDDSMMSDEEERYPRSPHSLGQIITEDGPAYVMRPVSPAEVENLSKPQDSGDESDSSEHLGPQYTVVREIPSELVPHAVGVQPSPEKPFLVHDSDKDEMMVAEPAVKPSDLRKPLVSIMEPSDKKPLKIHDNQTGKVAVAYPSDNIPSDSELDYPDIVMEEFYKTQVTPEESPWIQKLQDLQPEDETEEPDMDRVEKPTSEEKEVAGESDKDIPVTYWKEQPASDEEKEPSMVLSDESEDENDTHMPSKEDTLGPNSNTEALDVSPKYGKGDDEPISYDILLSKSMDQYDVYLEKPPIDPDTSDIPSRSGEDTLQPDSKTKALDVSPRYGEGDSEEVTDDAMLAKSMDQYDVCLEKPPVDPNVLDTPLLLKPPEDENQFSRGQIVTENGPAYTLRPVSNEDIAEMEEDSEGGEVPGRLAPEYSVVKAIPPISVPPAVGIQPVNDNPFIVQDPESGQPLLAKPAHKLSDLKKGVVGVLEDTPEKVLKIHDVDSDKSRDAIPSDDIRDQPLSEESEAEDEPSTQQVMTEKGPAFKLTPLSQEPISEDQPVSDEEDHDTPQVKTVEAVPDEKLPPVAGIQEVPHETFIVENPKTRQKLLAEPISDPDDLHKGLVGVLKDQPYKQMKVYDNSEPGEDKCTHPEVEEAKDVEKKKPKEAKKPAKQQILTKKGPAYVLRPLSDSDVDEDGVPLTSSLAAAGGGGSGGLTPDYTIQKSVPAEKVPPVIGIRKVHDDEPIYVQDPTSGGTMVAEPAANAGDLKTGVIGIIEGTPDRPMKIHDNDTGNVSVAVPSEDLQEDLPDKEAPESLDVSPKKVWTTPYSSIPPSETMDSGFGSRKTSISSKPRSELGSVSSVRDYPSSLPSPGASVPDEDPAQDFFEEASESPPSTPGFYTPDTGSPTLSREGTFVKEKPEEVAPATPAGLSAFGLIARALGLSPKEPKPEKEDQKQGKPSGEDTPDVGTTEESFKPTFAKPLLVKKEMTPEKLKKDQPPVQQQQSPVPLYKPIFTKETPVAKTPAEEVEGSPAAKGKAESPSKPGWPMTPPPEPLRTKVIFPDGASSAKTPGQGRKAPSGLPTLPEGVEKIDELNKSWDDLRLKVSILLTFESYFILM